MATTDGMEQAHAGWEPLDPGGVPVATGRYAVVSVPLLGGALCLDFTNTAVWRMRPTPDETLVAYDDLLAWSAMAGGIAADVAGALGAAAVTRREEADAVVARAVALREALYRVFVATMADVAPGETELTTVNAELRAAMAQAAVRSGAGGFSWDWPSVSDGSVGETPLARPLWPIVRSAADLLTGPELARVKRCPGDGCGWLFLDTSRNGSRRWCNMAGCGNRARVRAFAARKREGRET